MQFFQGLLYTLNDQVREEAAENKALKRKLLETRYRIHKMKKGLKQAEEEGLELEESLARVLETMINRVN